VLLVAAVLFISSDNLSNAACPFVKAARKGPQLHFFITAWIIVP
jgi:hypothetical protein